MTALRSAETGARLRAEIAAATAGRPGWAALNLCTCTAHHSLVVRTPGGVDYAGEVVGNATGWYWAVWRGINPLTSTMRDDVGLPDAAQAVALVEAYIADQAARL